MTTTGNQCNGGSMNSKKLALRAAILLALPLTFMFFSGRKSAAAGPTCSVPGDYSVIQDAVNDVGCTTINVAAGTYTENITIARALTLNGAQAGVDARGRSASESTIVPSVSANPSITIAFSGTITINGFSFSGGPTGSSGVIFTSVGPNNSMQIINNRFSNYPSAALWLNRGGSDITIDKNVLDGSSISPTSTAQAIFLNGPQSYAGINVTNNNIINNTNRYGLFVDGNHNVGESAARGALISGNLFDKNLQGMNLGSRSFGSSGTPVLGTYAGTISSNVFTNNVFDGVQGGPQHTLITLNRFQNNGRNALGLTSFGNTGADRGSQNSDITCNLFGKNGFTGGGSGVALSSTQVPGSIATNKINNNNFAANATGLTYGGTETIDATSNWWGNPTGPTIASNPSGTGDTINNPSGTVNYSSFLTSFSGCAPAPPTDSIGLFDGVNSRFFLRNSNNTGVADITYYYGPGGAGWIPIMGDWDGDGKVTGGLYDGANGRFFLRNSNSNGFADIIFSYGPSGAGWIPIVGDWNNDGIDTVGLYAPNLGRFFLRNSNTTGFADIDFFYGPAGAGWIPITGDWNGDGTTTIGLFDGANSRFFLRNTNDAGVADITFYYGPGGAGWIPITGDWDGDGKTTVGLFAPGSSIFFLRNSNTNGFADITFQLGAGNSGWKPLAGNWDGQ
jgi:hypothetical protein